MTSQPDVIVAGAGHNSLSQLPTSPRRASGARARGTNVLGGDTATEELTLPGFPRHLLDCAQPDPGEPGARRAAARRLRPRVHPAGPGRAHPLPRRHLAHACGATSTAPAHEFAKFSPRDARRLPADDGGVRGGQGRLRRGAAHADRVRPAARRSACRRSAGSARRRDERVGRRSRAVSRTGTRGPSCSGWP